MADISHLNVLCYRWGTRYTVDYVNILHAMVKRWMPVPFDFHCVTDNTEGLNPAIVAHDLPEYGFEGIWRKLMTFQDDFLGLNGQHIVSFDIDIVICGDLGFLLKQPEEPFYVGRNWSRNQGELNASGSVYRLKVGSKPDVWDDFIKDPAAAIEQYHGKNRDIGEQNWLNAHFDHYTYFPEGKVVSFKRHCNAKGSSLFGTTGDRLGLTTALFSKAYPPAGASVVSFHGDPLPPAVMHSRWGRWRHAPFVAEHWRI